MTWEEVTAVGTLAVAAVTGGLAWTTRRLAGAAVREARANWQPVLVPFLNLPRDESGDALLESDALEMGVRNVGRGPALMTSVVLWEPADDLHALVEHAQRGRTRADVVPPGEQVVFEWPKFETPKPTDHDEGLHFWSVLNGMVTYGDVGYTRYETELKLGFRADGAVSLLSYRFLGATIDRIGRVARAKNWALRSILILDHGQRGPLRRRLAHRVARSAVKRLG